MSTNSIILIVKLPYSKLLYLLVEDIKLINFEALNN